MRDLVMPNSFSRRNSSIREITLDLAFGRKMEIRDRLLDGALPLKHASRRQFREKDRQLVAQFRPSPGLFTEGRERESKNHRLALVRRSPAQQHVLHRPIDSAVNRLLRL